MKNAPETASGRNRRNRRSSTISRASLGRCPWDIADRQSLPRQSPMSAVEVSRIERPRRQPRFRSADMTADRSGGTSTGSLYTGRSSTVRQCYCRRCSIRLRLRGYTHHGGTHRSAMGLLSSVDACMPRHTGIQSTQDRPASTRQAPTKTGAQARYHDTLTAALQQPTTPAWTGQHCLHNPVTRRTPSQPADQGGCTVDITAGGRRTGFLTRRAKRRDYALSARPRSRTCVA